MSRVIQGEEEVHQHSGWLIPLGILAAIALLSAVFLVYDLRPPLGAHEGRRTGDPTPVQMLVRGVSLAVPRNYIESGAARAGGDTDLLVLGALFPGMRGWSADEARLFAGNAPDSPVVHILLKGDENDLDARARLSRIYMPYVVDPKGTAALFGLTQFRFRANSGYGREDLFAGTVGGRLMLFLCERTDPNLPSPNCLAVGRPIAPNLSLSYRFKRAYLARWQEISSGVEALLRRFQAR